MNTEHIVALLISERDKLNRAIEALGTPVKRRGRPPKNPLRTKRSRNTRRPGMSRTSPTSLWRPSQAKQGYPSLSSKSPNRRLRTRMPRPRTTSIHRLPPASAFSAWARRRPRSPPQRRQRLRPSRPPSPPFPPMRQAPAILKKRSSKRRSSTPRTIITPKPTNTTSKTTKRRRCPRSCAPATWAKCCRKLTSTTKFN